MGKIIFIPDISTHVSRSIVLQSGEEGHLVVLNPDTMEDSDAFLMRLKEKKIPFKPVRYDPHDAKDISTVLAGLTRELKVIHAVIDIIMVPDEYRMMTLPVDWLEQLNDLLRPHVNLMQAIIPVFQKQGEGDWVQVFHLPESPEYGSHWIFEAAVKALDGMIGGLGQQMETEAIRFMRVRIKTPLSEIKNRREGHISGVYPVDIAQSVLNLLTIHRRSVISEMEIQRSKKFQ